MLEVSRLQAFYGLQPILHGIDFRVLAGEVVTLIGRNGMGKTTALNAIMGLVPRREGRIAFEGQEIQNATPHRIARAGIGYVPEGRQVFPNLTVRENLVATAANRNPGVEPWTLDRIYAIFPKLSARDGMAADTLSGGEQQMLAIGRALMTNPRLLILDEATEGLAPLVRDDIWRVLEQVKKTGISAIIVDKNVAALARIADRHHILVKGKIVFTGDSAELMADPERLARHLGV